jgi:hypothetical protein
VRDQHSDGAGLAPVAEGRRTLEPGVVARERPDAPAQAGRDQMLALLQERERIGAQQLVERRAGARARDPPAHEAPQGSGIGEPYGARGFPQSVRGSGGAATVLRTYRGGG